MLKLDLEYLTKQSVKIEIDKTSTTREMEYRRGMKRLLFLSIGNEISLVSESTSLQHKFRPCPPTG